MLEQINKLENYFENMEKDGKVDPYLKDSLSTIDQIRKNLNKLDVVLLLKKDAPNQLFELHHLINVNLLIFDSMHKRLKMVKESNDNPKIAINSLNVLPFLKEGVHNINKLRRDELTLDLAMSLQMVASRNNLFHFESSKPKKNLGKIFGGIVEGIDLTV